MLARLRGSTPPASRPSSARAAGKRVCNQQSASVTRRRRCLAGDLVIVVVSSVGVTQSSYIRSTVIPQLLGACTASDNSFLCQYTYKTDFVEKKK